MLDPRDEFYQQKLQQIEGKWTGLDPEVTLVVLGVLHTGQCLESLLAADLQAFDLSSSAFNLLTILDAQHDQSMPLHELGRLLVTSRANVTGLVDSLCKKGYVERVPHASDRRIKLARLLPAGVQALSQALPGHIQRIGQLGSSLNSAERQQLVNLLAKLRNQALSLSEG